MAITRRLGIKTAWMSDIHLGSRHTHDVGMLSLALTHIAPRQLDILGDTIDGYELSRKPHWDKGCEEALQRLHALAQSGTQVRMIPGNHDEPLRGWLDAAGINRDNRQDHLLLVPRSSFPVYNGDGKGIRLMQQATFSNGEGTHIYMHGDENQQNDPAKHPLVPVYDAFYYRIAAITPLFNRLRPGRPYRALTLDFQSFACRHAMDFVGDFERTQTATAKAEGVAGVFCGHIHYPADKMVDGVHYRNPGSMQADQTLLIENDRGEIKQVNWGTIALRLRRAKGDGTRTARVLDEVAEQWGAERIAAPLPFTYRDPGVDTATGLLRSTEADLIATATFGRSYGINGRKMPVQPVL